MEGGRCLLQIKNVSCDSRNESMNKNHEITAWERTASTPHREKGKIPKRQKDNMKFSSSGTCRRQFRPHLSTRAGVRTRPTHPCSSFLCFYWICSFYTYGNTASQIHQANRFNRTHFTPSQTLTACTTTQRPHNCVPTIQRNNDRSIFLWIIWQGCMKHKVRRTKAKLFSIN